MKNKRLDIKISFIILQGTFGLINDNTIDKLGLNDDDIIKYLKNQNIGNGHIKVFMLIINIIIKKIKPSRCSIRPIDQLLFKKLKEILLFMNIDGIYYINNNIANKKLLCSFVNKIYGDEEESCTPTEICVFDPANKLGGVIMWQKINGKLLKINKKNKYSTYVRNNYNRLSLNDLYKISKNNSNG